MKRVDNAAPAEHSRRTMLRAGAAGTALWVTPVVFSMTATRADAASDGGPGDGGDGGGGETPVATCVPSNGLLFFQTATNGPYFGVKIESGGGIGRIPTSSQFQVPEPTTWTRYQGTVEGGFTFDDAGVADGLFLVLPAGAIMSTAVAYVADGNPTGEAGGGTPGHDFVEVTSETVIYSYTKAC